MKEYKIAICISGQPRTWKSTKENIKNFFTFKNYHPEYNVPITVDYFIHTWDCDMFGDVRDQPRQTQQNKDEEKIRDFYQPKMMEVEHFEEEKLPNPWDGLFYSFMKSVFLKRQWEIENDFTYNLVIKIRFDIIFNTLLPFFKLHEIQYLTCYTLHGVSKFPSEINHNAFDDVVFYSNSTTMDIISNVLRKNISDRTKISENIFDVDNYVFYGPGTLLYEFMNNYNIIGTSSQTFTNIYVIFRKEAQELNLDPIKDFNQIKNISDNWYTKINKTI